MKTAWTETTLADVADIKGGGRLKLSGKHFVEAGVPAWGAGGRNGYVPLRESTGPAVILSSIGARCGKCFYVDGEWTTLANTQIIRPDAEHVDARFLWYQLNDESRWPRSGSGQPFIKPADVKAHRIRFPPLDEQRRIACVLDAASELRAKRRQSIDLLDDLVNASFHALSDSSEPCAHWTVRALGDVARFFSGGTLPPGDEYHGQAQGAFLMKVSDMNRPGNEREIVSCALCSPEVGPRATTCPSGSVVIPKRGGAIGTNKKRLTTRPTALDPNLMAISPNAEYLTSEYLRAWFEQFDLSTITSGSSVPQLNKKDLAPLSIAIPPLPLQRTFQRVHAVVTRYRAVFEAHSAGLDSLFASLQHRTFNGEL